jgi:hypothetical protein
VVGRNHHGTNLERAHGAGEGEDGFEEASHHQTLRTRAAMKMKRAATITTMSQRHAALIACAPH